MVITEYFIGLIPLRLLTTRSITLENISPDQELACAPQASGGTGRVVYLPTNQGCFQQGGVGGRFRSSQLVLEGSITLENISPDQELACAPQASGETGRVVYLPTNQGCFQQGGRGKVSFLSISIRNCSLFLFENGM